jgi:hypothetical protein
MIFDGLSMGTGTAIVLGLSLFAATACKSSATEAPSLLDDPVPLGSGAALPALPLQTPWDPALCPPVPEPQAAAAFSDLTFGGTCAFRHEGRGVCRARGDDFYAIVRRKLADGSSAELFVNVEYYSGAGTYEKKVEILFIIQHGQSLYRWSNMQATMTLGMEGGGLSASDKLAYNAQGPTPLVAILPPTELEAEPGTKTSGKITLSGTIGCAPK